MWGKLTEERTASLNNELYERIYLFSDCTGECMVVDEQKRAERHAKMSHNAGQSN